MFFDNNFSTRIYDKHSKKKVYQFYLKLIDDSYFKIGVNQLNKFFTKYYFTDFEKRIDSMYEFAEYLERYHQNNNYFLNIQRRRPLIETIEENFHTLLCIMREPYSCES
ncbi:hypothetical protein [Candidatus Phytoplasma pyri]|uniref:hypothetical protein n=1 Tax=Candidatus Phytoplasma pyri TaxID=47566 RepID=UPI00398322E3